MENKIALVFGASGKTGQQICKKLNESVVRNFAFVRKGSEEKIESKKTEFIFGNVLNLNDIEQAIKAHQFTDVVIALGSRDLKKSFIRSTGTRNIVEVLNKLSIKYKIHVISALGVRESWSQVNWIGKLICKLFISSTMKDHGLQEDIVVNSSQKFHIIRPVGLTDGVETGKILNKTEGFMPSNIIARADVAKYLVDSMLADKNGFSSICKST
jgi:uncharacterized protein YbjT (DUF2867 family)